MTFYQWLTRQIARDDDIGKLSRRAVEDVNFPTEGTVKQFRAYLLRTEGLGLGYVDVFNEAWEEWLK